MKTMKLNFTKSVLLFSSIALIGLTGCKKDEETKVVTPTSETAQVTLVNNWSLKESVSEGQKTVYTTSDILYARSEFKSDGSLITNYPNETPAETVIGSYTKSGNNLVINTEGGIANYTYSISGNTLTITETESGDISVWTKL